MTRSETDSWDVASSVGATATMVAAARAVASREPSPLIDDPYAAPLVRAVGIEFFTRFADGELNVDDVDKSSTARLMTTVMAVRTKFFDDFFTAAAANGIRQAVILASGLDSRPYRLPWPDGTVVYEIDQPQVIEFKTATMSAIGATPSAERRAVAIDLRDDWSAALRRSGFDDAVPTAWSAEGLLVYLPPEAQDRLFDTIAALSAPGSRLATEYVPSTDIFTDERAQARSERWRRLGMNVDMRELVYDGKRSHVIRYLEAGGWHVTADDVPDLYTANGFTFPDDEDAQAMADAKYITATLK
jgi:methyltransferase (TIGR00027 family)